MERLIVRPDGEILFAQRNDGDTIFISVLLRDPLNKREVEVEFRLSDFVTFSDYAAMVASEVLFKDSGK